MDGKPQDVLFLAHSLRITQILSACFLVVFARLCFELPLKLSRGMWNGHPLWPPEPQSTIAWPREHEEPANKCIPTPCRIYSPHMPHTTVPRSKPLVSQKDLAVASALPSWTAGTPASCGIATATRSVVPNGWGGTSESHGSGPKKARNSWLRTQPHVGMGQNLEPHTM